MKLFRVDVYLANMLMDFQYFNSEIVAMSYASEMQDSGYKVRFVENV